MYVRGLMSKKKRKKKLIRFSGLYEFMIIMLYSRFSAGKNVDK
jgi:hypothetical protein